eukprot:4903201-Prymnesium_polylepis.1
MFGRSGAGYSGFEHPKRPIRPSVSLPNFGRARSYDCTSVFQNGTTMTTQGWTPCPVRPPPTGYEDDGTQIGAPRHTRARRADNMKGVCAYNGSRRQ